MTAAEPEGGFGRRDPRCSVLVLRKNSNVFPFPQTEMEKSFLWVVSSQCEEPDLPLTGIDSTMTYMDFCYPGDN